MKRLLLILGLLTLFIITNLSNTKAEGKKVVLLEQFTGTWSGFCVGASLVFDEILEQYPEQVIGVKYHNRDSMVTKKGNHVLDVCDVKYNSYPSAAIDRNIGEYNEKDYITMPAFMWKEKVELQLESTPKVDVSCKWNLNKSNQRIYVRIEVKVLSDINEQIALNALLIEDNVVGQGVGFDHYNAYSGRIGSEDHPYYDQPSTIKGYIHKNVVRQVIGDGDGFADIFPKKVKAGEKYAYNFSIPIPEVAGNPINLNNISMVAYALIKEKGQLPLILNVTKGKKVDEFFVSAYDEAETIISAMTDETKTITFTIDNPTDKEITGTIAIASIDAPFDWTVSLVGNNNIVIPANSIHQVNIDLLMGTTMTVGQYLYTFTYNDGADDISIISFFRAINSSTENLILDFGSYESNQADLTTAGFKNSFVLSPDYLYGNILFDAIPNFKNIKKVVILSGDGIILPDEVGKQMQIWKSIGNIDILIIGSKAYMDYLPPRSYRPNNTAVFDSYGFKEDGWFGYVYKTLCIKGVKNDAVTNNIDSIISYYGIDRGYLNITDASKANPILYYNIVSDRNIAGIKAEVDNSKLVAIAFSIQDIESDEERIDLLSRIYRWFEGDVSVLDNLSLSLKVRPNPVNSRATLEYIVSGVSANVNIKLIDITGHIISELVDGIIPQGQHFINLNTSELSTGTYYIIYNINATISSTPIIVN